MCTPSFSSLAFSCSKSTLSPIPAKFSYTTAFKYVYGALIDILRQFGSGFDPSTAINKTLQLSTRCTPVAPLSAALKLDIRFTVRRSMCLPVSDYCFVFCHWVQGPCIPLGPSQQGCQPRWLTP